MRIAIGSLMQETNTFLPVPTTIETFRRNTLRYGDAVFGHVTGARVEIAGFLDILRMAGAEPVPLLAGHAGSSGPLRRADFDLLVDQLAGLLRDAGPVDGVLLALHGAMVVEDAPDAEAEIIARLRVVLPEGTPIGVSLDLHGHITPAMLQPDTFFIAYREYPHIDMFETGQRVARLLLDRLRGGVRPVMALAKRPMLLSPIAARSDAGPLVPLMAEARRREAGKILHASLFPVQPWLDVPDLGFAVLVCADADSETAQATADALADLAWAARDAFEPDLVPLEDAIAIGLAADGTTVIGDGGDAPSSGAAGDNAAVLRALLRAGADHAGRLSFLTLCDPQAATAAARVGIGATVTLVVGHEQTRDGDPVEITGRVQALTDDSYVMHDAGAQGSRAEMGLVAVLAIGDVRLAIRSLPANEWDTGVYRSVGLDFRDAALVFVKSPSHFRIAYAPIADRILAADTPGVARGNMRHLAFSRVTRPLHPLDS